MIWNVARRACRMEPSTIWEALKISQRPGVISFAVGLPSSQSFPVGAFADACDRVLRTGDEAGARAALQYAASDGHPLLREWVAERLPWRVDPSQVLITNGSQQGLDLLSRVLLDDGSRVFVEAQTYPGALQAFAPTEPDVAAIRTDAEGVCIDDLLAKAAGSGARARFLYVLPNFQNPTGRTMTEARRKALVERALAIGLPLVEDDPYGELWFEKPPPPPLAALHPEGCVYLGSFSKVLAPGFRLGYVVAPNALALKLLQAKQASDLHSPSFNQRVMIEVLRDGFLDRHLPAVREQYRTRCQTMLNALQREFRGAHPLDVEWTAPDGGMFLWLRLPDGLNAMALLPHAVDKGVAFIPGAAFQIGESDPRTLRFSFAAVNDTEIDIGVAAFANVVREQYALLF